MHHDADHCFHESLPPSRRDWLRSVAAGLPMLALSDLLRAAPSRRFSDTPSLSPQRPHLPARCKRVVFLFMHGGPSQVDTFDYKPLLQRDHGKPLPFAKPRVTFAETGNLLGSPFRFAQHGQSGAFISELFPHIAGCADQICFLKG
ncbi:MAG: DUF1501 domain-containing protein, partial [Planctomycetota bacterium]